MTVLNNLTHRLLPNRQGATPAKATTDSNPKPTVDSLKQLDTNKDGKLDRTEFSKSTVYQNANERERELLSKAFEAAASKAGQIDTDAGFTTLAGTIGLIENPAPAKASGEKKSLFDKAVDGLKSAYNAVTSFAGDMFSKMKDALSDFLSWGKKTIEENTNGFFDEFQTEVTRRPSSTSTSTANKRLKETEGAEAEALAKLSSSDQDAYKSVAGQLQNDPVAQLTLREMLLDGRLPGEKDLTGGKTLLGNLADLASKPMLDGLNRSEVISEVLDHIDDPITIHQRQQRTCGPTTGQLLLARQEPSEYVRLAVSLSSPEGEAKLQNGDTVTRGADWNDRGDDERSTVNRLFQTALMDYANGGFDYDNVKDVRKIEVGPFEFEMPGLLPHEMNKLVESLTGRDYKTEYSLFSKKVGDDFKAALDKVGPGTEIPVILNYNVDGEGLEATSPHYVLVTGYDAESGTVSISNPWGREEKMPLEELQSHLIASFPLA